MCGICGFISKKNISLEILTAMNDTMIHRGPDDSGVEIYEGRGGYNVGFAQRRLSIMDLSDKGHQPMHSADHGVSVVFNGEIYNFLELKEELRDYPFVSNCDTEVIIASYLKWGRSCADHFNGMFAIALYDRKSGEVYLFRDRAGKKPLFYFWDGDMFIFASELKAIMRCPAFERKLNRAVLGRYLHKNYIADSDSIFENTYKLIPGGYLIYRDGTVNTDRYWDINKHYRELSQDKFKSYAEVKLELKELLRTRQE